MEYLFGECVSPGVALAAASRVLEAYGIATLPAIRMARVADAIERDPLTPVEVEEIILVARRPPMGLLHGTVAGYKIAGLALADYPEETFDLGIPCVCGLGDLLLTGVHEGDMLLIDGSAGSVIIDPDASLVAQFQTPQRLRRYFLSDAHLPAKTASDNRVIQVFAALTRDGGVDDALAHGADGLCILALTPHIVSSEAPALTSAEQKRGIAALIDRAAGLPILVDLPTEQIALTIFLDASKGAPIEIVVGGGIDNLQATHQEIALALSAVPYGVSGHLALMVAVAPDADTEDYDIGSLNIAGGLVFRDGVSDIPGGILLPLLGYAARTGKTTTTYLPADDWAQELENAVSLGITRIVCRADHIQDVKDAIRQL